jgi:hypothetical protein
VPDSDSDNGSAVAEVATASRAVRLTADDGANVTLIVQLELPGSCAGQSFDWLNAPAPLPDSDKPATANGALPRFDSVAVSVLVAPTATDPNRRAVGLSAAAGSTRTVRDRVSPPAVPTIRGDTVASTGLV